MNSTAARGVRDPARADRVLPETRWVSYLLLPFLVGAWAILYLLPERAGELFAWPIRPTMTAMLMGAGYLAGAYFFWRAARAREWHTVGRGFLPVAFFAALDLLTTALHWPRFTHGHPAFITWLALYIISPLLVLGLWLRNRPADPRSSASGDVEIPSALRWTIGGLGGLFLIAGLVFYLTPETMIAIWPWMLTPLNARAVLGFIILSAITEISMALDPRWSAYRIILQGQMLGLALMLLAALRTWPEFNPDLPGRWIFAAGLLLLLLFNLGVYLWMERRGADGLRS